MGSQLGRPRIYQDCCHWKQRWNLRYSINLSLPNHQLNMNYQIYYFKS
jgi:hypothetical protein